MTERDKNAIKPKPLILLVDDVPENLQVLGTILESKRYDISLAANGRQAIDLIQDIRPDLILLDVMMPEMDGFEVCRKLKESQDTQHIPIIFLTAKTDAEDIVKGFELGAADYVTKPFNAAELLARVDTHLKLKFSEEALRDSKEYIEAIWDTIPSGIAIIDPETRKVVDLNPHAAALIGASREKIVGSECHEFICPENQDNCPIEASGSCRKNEDHNIRKSNGELIPVLKTVIRKTIGNRDQLLESFIDISERKRVEYERIQKEKLQGVVEMAGAVCHELNQPMQVVSITSELLLQDLKEDGPHYGEIKSIKEETFKMGAITDKLMRITRYETKDYLKGKIIDIEKAVQ